MPPLKLNGSLVMLTMPSNNPAQTSEFFQNLLGIEFTLTLEDAGHSYHAPVDEGGIDLQIGPRRNAQEQPAFYFAVDDLDATIRRLGVHPVWGPADIAMSDQSFQVYEKALRDVEPGAHPTKSMGRAAIVTEPGGGGVGLVQLADHVQPYFKAGPQRRSLDEKQVAYHNRSVQAARERHGRER